MQTLSKTGLERAGQAGLPLSMPTGCLCYSADGIGRIQPRPSSQSRVEPGPSWEHTLEPLGWRLHPYQLQSAEAGHVVFQC